MRTAGRFLFCLILLAALLGGALLAGCDDDDDDNDDQPSDDDIADDDNDGVIVDDDTLDDDAVDDDVIDDDTLDDDLVDDDTAPPYDGTHLIPGPDEEGYDADLEGKADRYDRTHLLFSCSGNGVNCDLSVSLANPDHRELIEDFIQETDSWDFEDFSGGLTPLDIITTHHKVAGLYGGVGIAADAFRYGVFRDQGYPAADVDRAREFLLRDIDRLILAYEITGTTGVIARGFCRMDVPGYCATLETTPLFDAQGNPLPEEKNNGTWREDNTADNRYANYRWEDSCSRDQFIGWATAFGAIWEVIRDDDSFDAEIKDKLQQYASEIGRSLMVPRYGGPGSLGQAFDLEIFDADGRTTYHGYLNENAVDRFYAAWLPFKDGLYSLMSLGIVAALTYCSEDPVLEEYLYGHLIGERHLDVIAQNNQFGVNLWWITNYSTTNMAMAGSLLAQRYLDDETARKRMRYTTEAHLYLNGPFLIQRQPEEYAYSLFDFTYATAVSGASAFNSMLQAPEFAAIERGVQTLFDFQEPPYWQYEVINCDEDEINSGHCVLNDGTEVTVLGYVGRNGTLLCKEPIPHAVRPGSNYHWRSCPYTPNGGGDGSGMNPGVDFRLAYWYGRWVQ